MALPSGLATGLPHAEDAAHASADGQRATADTAIGSDVRGNTPPPTGALSGAQAILHHMDEITEWLVRVDPAME